MNFRVIEGKNNDDEIYPKFKEDYLHTKIPVHTLREKYGLSYRKIDIFTHDIIEETGFSRKKHRYDNDAKFYSVRENKDGKKRYVVSKKIGDGYVGFGTYSSQSDAEKIVSEMKSLKWDKNELYKIQEKYNIVPLTLPRIRRDVNE